MLWTLLIAQVALANDVMVPMFSTTAGTAAAGSEIMYAETLQALRDRNIEVLDADDLQTFVGDRANNCAVRPNCPDELWPSVRAKLAILGTVEMVDSRMQVSIEFHRSGQPHASEVAQADLDAKEAGHFAVDIALIAADMLAQGDDPMIAAAPVPTALDEEYAASSLADPPEMTEPPEMEDPAIETEPEPAPEPVQEEVEEPAPAKVAAAPVESMDETDERRVMGVPKGAYDRYKASGKTRDEWLAASRVRSGSFFAEMHAGVVFGDIRRRFATRAALQEISDTEFSAVGYYQRDGLLPGTAFSIAAAAGYAPAWWMDLGLLVGMEFPRKELVTGWEAYATQEQYDARTPCATCTDQTVFQPATAVVLLVEPRVRFTMVPTGFLKPYLLGGWSTRFHDGYQTPDLVRVVYPDRPGVQSFGPTAGLGIGYDPRKRASGLIEATGTKLLGPGLVDTGRNFVAVTPIPEEGSGYLMTIRASVVSRF